MEPESASHHASDEQASGPRLGRTVAWLPAAAVVAVLAGCGGGGGGGGAGVASPVIPRSLDTDYEIAGQVEAELARVNYDANVGQAGTGVKIALVARGFDATHPTFAGRTVSDPLTPSLTPIPSNILHGTKVAMLASGLIDKQVFGVAYGSMLEYVDYGVILSDAESALDHLGTTSDAFVVNFPFGADLLTSSYEVDQARCALVRGLSSGSCSDGILEFYMRPEVLLDPVDQLLLNACVSPVRAAEDSEGVKERICVFAAGDDGLHAAGKVVAVKPSDPNDFFEEVEVSDLLGVDSPLMEADKQAFQDELYTRGGMRNLPKVDKIHIGHYIVVALLERDSDRLVDSANACGDAYMHCLSVPYSQANICPTDTTADMPVDPSGVCDGSTDKFSDYAAPIVSGAAAVLKSTYPHLSAPSVVSILLETAEDIGPVDGPDEDFGWGKLDIQRSLQPVGEKRTPAGESLSGTVIKAGPSLGPALSRSAASFGMFDSYKRPYLHFVSGRVSFQGSALDALDGFMRDSSALVNADVRQRMGLLGTGETRTPAAVVLRRFDDDAIRIDSGFEDCSLGCLASRVVKANSLVPSTARAWSEQHVSVPFGRIGTVVEVGFANDSDAGFSSGGLFYAGRLGESSLLRLEAGALVEHDTFMGSGFGGALELGAGRGQYVSAQLGAELGTGAFSASYTLGKERAGRAIGSLVTEVSDATYDGYRIAYGGKGWELHHTVPLAATGGGMRIESVGGYTGGKGDWSVIDSGGQIAIVGSSGSDDWAYRTDSHWIDFSAAGRERRTGVVLNRPHGSWNSVLAFEHVSNSPREGHVGNEARIVVGLELDFD